MNRGFESLNRSPTWNRPLRRASSFLPAGLTTALVLSGGHLPGIHCPVRALTGIPCPTCYLTRATAAALQGRVLEAAQLHLFGPAAAALLLGWSALAIRKGRLLPPALPAAVLVPTGLALFLYWLLRLIASSGVALAGVTPLPP